MVNKAVLFQRVTVLACLGNSAMTSVHKRSKMLNVLCSDTIRITLCSLGLAEQETDEKPTSYMKAHLLSFCCRIR